VRLRNGSDGLIGKLKKFAGLTDDLARERNRVVHDPWLIVGDEPGRLVITAERRPVFQFRPDTADRLKEVEGEIKKAISGIYPTLARASIHPKTAIAASRSIGVKFWPKPDESGSNNQLSSGPGSNTILIAWSINALRDADSDGVFLTGAIAKKKAPLGTGLRCVGYCRRSKYARALCFEAREIRVKFAL
jgi:hypothetical protein